MTILLHSNVSIIFLPQCFGLAYPWLVSLFLFPLLATLAPMVQQLQFSLMEPRHATRSELGGKESEREEWPLANRERERERTTNKETALSTRDKQVEYVISKKC